MKTPDNDLKKKLEKIKKKLMESEEISTESTRRYQVANQKLAGYLIELIESKRDKLKEKSKLGRLLGIFLRINDLKIQVMMEYLPIQAQSLMKVRPLKILTIVQTTTKMVEVYEQIRTDLASFFYNENSKSLNLPYISSKLIDPESKLKQLNICLGQLQGLVIGRLYEFAS